MAFWASNFEAITGSCFSAFLGSYFEAISWSYFWPSGARYLKPFQAHSSAFWGSYFEAITGSGFFWPSGAHTSKPFHTAFWGSFFEAISGSYILLAFRGSCFEAITGSYFSGPLGLLLRNHIVRLIFFGFSIFLPSSHYRFMVVHSISGSLWLARFTSHFRLMFFHCSWGHAYNLFHWRFPFTSHFKRVFSQRFQARTFVPLKPCRVHSSWGSCHLKPFGHCAFHSISWFMTFEAHLAMKAFEGF